jgi:preprotein translocase subunit Sss1
MKLITILFIWFMYMQLACFGQGVTNTNKDSLLTLNTDDLAFVSDSNKDTVEIIKNIESAVNEHKEVIQSAQKTASSEYDKIIKISGDVLVVKISDKNIHEVAFTYPLNTVVNKVNLSDVNAIIHADGNYEVIDHKTAFVASKDKYWTVVASELEWAKVAVINDIDSVSSSMIQKAPVKAKYVADKMTADPDLMLKNCVIIMKKKAVRQGANILLITDKKFFREYGELPYVEVTGLLYYAE